MASAFITYSYQINFESVLMMHDHDGMLNMFKALETSGLRGFLGCESVLYEKELQQFFETALVQGEDITGAVSGKFFSISQAQFSRVFELPTEGIVNFSDVPKDKVYDARSFFSKKGSFDAVTVERFQMMTTIHYGLKVNWGKVLFNVLKDMVDRSQKKAKGFAAQIGVLLKGMPNITMGDGVSFPSAKILSMKTVNTYIATNTTIDAREEQGMVGEAIVKRKSKSMKQSSSADTTPVKVISEVAGSKKRVATEDNTPAIPKKRRIVKTKPSFSQASLDIVNVAQDVVPIQVIDPTPAVATITSPAHKRKSRKRRLVLSTAWKPVQGPEFWRSSYRLSLFLNKTEMPAPALHDIFVSIDVCIKLSNIGIPRHLYSKLGAGAMFAQSIQTNSEIDLSSSDGSTVYRSPSPISPEDDSFEHDLRFALGPAIFSSVEQEERLYFVQSPESCPSASPHQESSPSSTDFSVHFDSTDVPLNARADTRASATVDFTMFTDSLEDLRSSIFQRIHDSNCEILSKVNAVELGVRGDLLKLQVLLRQSLENACRVLERQGTTQATQINDLKKGLMAPIGTIFKDLFDIKKKQREQDSKIIALDGQIAAIRSEQLDFQTKIAADILSLSTQVGDITDYIRGGDAKKREIGSSSRPSTVRTQTQTFPPTTELLQRELNRHGDTL
ncbi:trichohyalin-like [Dorcoceras hygrometricum]|uniref:Trichohyalin-like n=1 Tax=Dorcoceras hygrometricum TaxID=472368 RepID=A0A2Z7ARS7_9LAMI|nr:trichohyalin-like [Dorcoceras hygrometricum]